MKISRVGDEWRIEITRGDYGAFTVELSGYEAGSSDTVTFTVKKNITDDTAVISKTVAATVGVIELLPADTTLAYGVYVHDVQLQIDGDEKPITLCDPSAFEVVRGVTE